MKPENLKCCICVSITIANKDAITIVNGRALCTQHLTWAHAEWEFAVTRAQEIEQAQQNRGDF